MGLIPYKCMSCVYLLKKKKIDIQNVLDKVTPSTPNRLMCLVEQICVRVWTLGLDGQVENP